MVDIFVLDFLILKQIALSLQFFTLDFYHCYILNDHSRSGMTFFIGEHLRTCFLILHRFLFLFKNIYHLLIISISILSA